jgi:hypothetical protein
VQSRSTGKLLATPKVTVRAKVKATAMVKE